MAYGVAIKGGRKRLPKNFFRFLQNFFQKPLDKSKIPAIIKVQKERNEQKMFGTFKKLAENIPMHN